MLGPSWISLFEQIPAKYHDGLVLTMVTGSEIMMQSMLRLESDFAILRGRMAGSTDAGKVIILPYDQIVNLSFAKTMKEPEIKSIFGDIMESAVGHAKGDSSSEESANNEAGQDEAATDSTDTPQQEAGTPMKTIANHPTPKGNAPPPSKNPPQAPSKSILLARLRARLAEQGK
jgi:hypothetical protein